MLTVGVDLAAEAEGTAVASIGWSATTGAVLRDLVHPADDAAVVAAIRQADKAGIDCPLGWPDEFVSFVQAHRSGAVTMNQPRLERFCPDEVCFQDGVTQ